MKKIFLIAAAALALAACDNNEDYTPASPAPATISATIGESTVSRTAGDSWSAGDEIGISSIVGNALTPYVNIRYTTAGTDGNFKGDTVLYFYKPMSLIAYYPFTGDEGTLPGVGGVIEADTRSEAQKSGNQSGIDFLWDSQTGFTPTNTMVNFKFAHKMSKLTLAFQSSDAVEKDGKIIAGPVNVSDMVRYAIDGLVLGGTFDTVTGVCAVKPGETAATLAMDVENVTDNRPVSPLILFPQTIKDGSAVLNIYTNELHNMENLQHYKCNLSFSNGEIKPGYHYKYTIKVSKIGLIVGEMTVEPWEEEYRYMTATIDGEKVFD